MVISIQSLIFKSYMPYKQDTLNDNTTVLVYNNLCNNNKILWTDHTRFLSILATKMSGSIIINRITGKAYGYYEAYSNFSLRNIQIIENYNIRRYP